ncbi:MAG: zinc ribbon domain-containing protein [Acidobacteria bacterium]|nr:zinc ribbon domain-containing protein [Acidobacteriota bacterium]
MFCNHCGAQIQSDTKFCPSCGKPVIPGAAPSPAPAGRLGRHVRLLGIFWVALSALRLLGGLGRLGAARMVRFAGETWLDGLPWGWSVPHFLPRILSAVGLGMLILGLAGLIAGWGLLERRPWARTLAIVLAVIALFNPILGTALGIYTLWALLPAQSEQEWRRIAG